jgi:hypothetical protein
MLFEAEGTVNSYLHASKEIAAEEHFLKHARYRAMVYHAAQAILNLLALLDFNARPLLSIKIQSKPFIPR